MSDINNTRRTLLKGALAAGASAAASAAAPVMAQSIAFTPNGRYPDPLLTPTPAASWLHA